MTSKPQNIYHKSLSLSHPHTTLSCPQFHPSLNTHHNPSDLSHLPYTTSPASAKLNPPRIPVSRAPTRANRSFTIGMRLAKSRLRDWTSGPRKESVAAVRFGWGSGLAWLLGRRGRKGRKGRRRREWRRRGKRKKRKVREREEG